MMTKTGHRWFAALALMLPAVAAQAQQVGPGYAPAPPSTAAAPAGSYYARVAGQMASSSGLANPYAAMQQSTQPVIQPQLSHPSAPAGPQSAYRAMPTNTAAPTGLRFPAAPAVAPQTQAPPTMAGPASRMTVSPLNGLQQVAWQQPRSFTQSRTPSPTSNSNYHAALLMASNQPTLAPPQNAGGANIGGMPSYPTTPNFASSPVVTETIGSPAVDGLPSTTYSGAPTYPPLSSYPSITAPSAAPVMSAPAPTNSPMWQQPTPAPTGAYQGMTPPRMPPMGPSAYPDPNVSGPVYDGMFDAGPTAASADWMQTGGPCNSCDPCAAGNCGPWFASISGLYMTRDAPNNVGLAFLNAVPQISVLNTELAGYDWKGGFELKLGRTLGENWALETNFWYLDPSGSTTSVRSDANDISSRLDTQNLAYLGQPMSDYYNNAHEQRVNRTNDFMNLEINLWQQALEVDPGSRWGMAFFSGVRWFRFREMVEYGTVMAGAEFEDNDITTQSWYHVRLTNNLIGWQLGARSQLYLGPKLRLFAVPRAGLFANVLSMHQDFCMVINNSTEKTDIAMLGQIDLGAAYQLFNCCSMFISYRAMGIAGVANADDNIQPWLISQPDMMQVQSSGSLIMHGVNAGLQFQF